MVPGRIIQSCAILLAFGCAFITTAQIREIAPARVIDMRTVTAGLLGETCTAIQAVATVGRRWAALLTCPGNQSVVVWGDLKDMHTAVLQGRFNRMAMDAAYNIALTSYPVAALASAGVTKVTVLDSDGHLSKNLKLTRLDVRPLMVGGEIRWATDAGVFKDEELSAVSPSSAQIPGALSVAPPATDHILYYCGLPSGGSFTIGNLTESITQYDEHSQIVALRALHLDDAYRRIGIPFTPPDIPNGITRIIWGSPSRNGLLYVGLSETPVAGPAYVAGVDPLTGDVRDVIRAALPRSSRRIMLPSNPSGVICPLFGAVDEHTILADASMQILVVY